MLKKLISFPYQLAHLFRETFFKLTTKPVKLAKPVISIGNISFGGTGKTPFCFELVKYFSEQGLKLGILSRGYKSDNESSSLFFSSLDSMHSPSEIGDEPSMLAKKFKEEDIEVFFAIGKNRIENGKKLLEIYPQVDILVLDDGLQYFKLHRDIEIILHSVSEQGFFREFDFALEKADFLIYTKAPEEWIKQNLDKNTLFFNLSLNKLLHDGADVGVFTGIADCITFQRMLENHIQTRFNRDDVKVKAVTFPDHHFFNLQEITKALDSGIQLVTTEKDWVKIPEEFHSKFVLAKLNAEFNPKDLLSKIFQFLDKRG